MVHRWRKLSLIGGSAGFLVSLLVGMIAGSDAGQIGDTVIGSLRDSHRAGRRTAAAELAVPKSARESASRGPRQSTSKESEAAGRQLPARLLDEAADTLQRQPALAAKVRCRIDIGRQHIVGSGSYLSAGDVSGRLRWSMRFQVGEQQASFEQVSDGHTFWERRAWPNAEPELVRVDLDRIREQLKMPHGAPLPVGGLGQLLALLTDLVEFRQLTEHRLGNLPVLALRGEWMSDSRAWWGELQPDQSKLSPQHGLPASIMPAQVVLFLGQADRIPYRVEFRSGRAGQGPAETRGNSPSTISLVAMELYDAGQPSNVDESMFVFDPGASTLRDETAAATRRLAARMARVPAHSVSRRLPPL